MEKAKRRGRFRYFGLKDDVVLPKHDAHRAISAEDASRAVYLDFESTVNDAPALLGYQVENEFVQLATDPRLAEAAAAAGLQCVPLDDAIREVLRRCAEERRLLVGYSQHERNVIYKRLEIDVADVYRDARMIAVRWKNRMKITLPRKDRDLKTFLAAVGYRRRNYLGEHNSARWIREVISMTERRGAFAELTPVKKAFWTKLLEHNRVDCDGMRELVLTAAKGLSGPAASPRKIQSPMAIARARSV